MRPFWAMSLPFWVQVGRVPRSSRYMEELNRFMYSTLVYFVTSVGRCRRSVIWRASRIDKGINRRLENPPAPRTTDTCPPQPCCVAKNSVRIMYLGLDYPFVYFNQFRHLCLFLLRKLFVMSMPAKLRGLAVLGLPPGVVFSWPSKRVHIAATGLFFRGGKIDSRLLKFCQRHATPLSGTAKYD